MFFVRIFVVFDHPELQVQESYSVREEGRIRYGRAHLEADGFHPDSVIHVAGHGVARIRGVVELQRKEQAAAGVGKEAGCDTVGVE
uniref:Uncharacterized protein n=1 Tax=Rhizophora mucronata TaxID=61149 RepID=A0A2P2QNW8_RHIMU